VPVGIDLDAGENGVWGAGRRSAQDASIAMFTLGMPVVDKAVNRFLLVNAKFDVTSVQSES
jgi:hypothetical protein